MKECWGRGEGGGQQVGSPMLMLCGSQMLDPEACRPDDGDVSKGKHVHVIKVASECKVSQQG